jgi:uncharacterized protein with HEPN domain
MRHERLYLVDILEASASVAHHIGAVSAAEFVADRTIRAAGLRDRHAAVPWPDIIAFRNIIVHE